MSSFDRILPFVRPLEHLLRDPTITEVMVNAGGRRVFVERDGRLEAVSGLSLDERNHRPYLWRRDLGRAAHPGRAAGGRLTRGAAMFPPCSVSGPTLTIRKFTTRYALGDLVSAGTLPESLAETLWCAVQNHRNILISGGTGTGKTTLLNALAATIPDADRIVLIEETSEVMIDKPNLVRFEARRAQAPLGGEAPLPGHDRGSRSRDAPPSAGPHSPGRGARRRGVRPAPGPQHRPHGDAEHHPREHRRAGAHALCALCANHQRGAPARQHTRGHRIGHPCRGAYLTRRGRPPRHPRDRRRRL
jgi:energy-coupling factor transporter ATP-binding protein EcfA2